MIFQRRSKTRRAFSRASIALLLLTMLALPLIAQEEEMEEQPVRRSRSGLAGAGGGVIPTWFFMNADELNTSLQKGGLPNLPTNGLFLFGGGGYFYVGFVKNLRLGGFGASGGSQEEKTVNGIFRASQFDISYGGGSIEYVLPLGKFQVAVGALIGGGSATLVLTRTTGSSHSWDDALASFGDAGSAIGTRHELTNGFFTYQPMLSLEYLPIPFVSMRLTGGYFGISGSSWELDGRSTLTGTPDMKFSKPFVQFGLFVGAFLTN